MWTRKIIESQKREEKQRGVTMSEKKQSDKLLKVLVVALIAAVGAQTWFIYQMMNRTEKSEATKANPSLAQPRDMAKCPLPPMPTVKPQAPGAQTAPQGQSMNSLVSALRNALGPQAGGMSGFSAPSGSAGNSIAQNQLPQNSAQPPLNINMFGGSPMGFGSNDPMEEIRRMHEMMEKMFSSMSMNSGAGFGGRPSFGGGTSMNGMDVFQGRPTVQLDDKNNYVVKFKIPGLEKSDINTEINDDILTISGTQKETIQNKQGNQIVAQGETYRQFQNSFSLPGPVKSDQMKVDYQNDTLTIVVPKA